MSLEGKGLLAGRRAELARLNQLLADLATIKEAVEKAWTNDVPTVLEIPVSPQVPPLI